IRDSPETRKALGATYLWAKQYDLGIEQFKAALDLDPAHADTFDLLADAYAAKGMFQEALNARRDYLRLEGAYEAAEALGNDGSESGYRRGMTNLYRRYLAKLNEDASKHEAVSPLEFALIYIGLGETEPAFKALDEAYRAHAPWLASLEADPVFDPIRSDERFAKLVAKVRVPYRPF
ncbi:MAG TPA: hypothetical protein VM493_06310, partial [Vicinamibacterales bacterium]|nr:hypothetical protein [Vicinamibacterales bacterium]